jgi:aromatic ring-opening dioxygenase catalytic subunit (LigB family)
MGFSKAEMQPLRDYLKSLASVPAQKPKALVVVSAHWEEEKPTVMTSASPPMLYDYYGFPPESYTLQWSAPGEPELAARVKGLLEGAGFQSAEDPARGFDHGTFVPLKLTYPKADIPTVQLSLKKGLDPAEHLAMGKALAPLRDEGVFLLGSGMSYHNMRGFGRAEAQGEAHSFDQWLQETAGLPAQKRNQRLSQWEKAPAARAVHPREEHLLPLMVMAGAAGEDLGQVAFNGIVMGVQISAVHFG